jgi:hypothetical protein
MDVLKGITDGLRSGDEDGQEETERAGSVSRRGREASESTGSQKGGEPPSESDAPETGKRNEDDLHLCSFCEAEFDAGRDSCPECDAKIVLRGAR